MRPASAKAKGLLGEREVAAILGGSRNPLSGAVGGGDIKQATLPQHWQDWSWESKRRARLPAIVTAALEQAASDIAIGDPRKPAAVMREDRGRWLFCAYLEDVACWANALAEVGRGSRIRELARELEGVAREMRGMT